MKYILDTHTFIWSILDNKQLSKNAKNLIINGTNEIFVSTLSLWEISLKTALGKFTFTGLDPLNLVEYASSQGFSFISLDPEEAQSYSSLPQIKEHKDPFDRMLIWQSINRKIPIITKDSIFPKYKIFGLEIVW
jgi:PIN domain nuclease of toxin-antitoxin system